MDAPLTAKLLAIPSALFLGSYNLTFSQNVMTHLYTQPTSVITPIFDKIYHRGASTIIPIATIAIAANGYLAYQHRGSKRQAYGTAAALVFSTLPLTAFVMAGGINRMIAISRDTALRGQAGVNKEVLGLVKTWVAQNYFRGSLHLTAGILALYAALT